MRSARVSAVLLLLLLAVLALLSSTSVDARRPHSRRSGAAVPTTDSQPLRTVDSSNIDRAFSELQPAASAAPAPAPSPRRKSVPGPGAFGMDISVAVTASEFQCLVSEGYSFVIQRAWRSLCQFDPNVLASIDAAWVGGMSQVDVYLYPQKDCNLKPEQQVQLTLAGLQGHNFSTFWFDIESEGSSWTTPAENLAWIRPAIQEAVATLGVSRVGIYTNKNNWMNVTGDAKEFGYLPVWYAHYNNEANFNDWVPFGDWKVPSIKQYMDRPPVCGVPGDHNYVPL